jgi:hypothetical protein
LTEAEVRAYIRAVAASVTGDLRGKNLIEVAINTCKEMPYFLQNDHNMDLLEKIENEGIGRHKIIKPAAISQEDRTNLAELFFNSYLNWDITPDEEEKAKRKKRYTSIFGEEGQKLAIDEFAFLKIRYFLRVKLTRKCS